MNFFARPWVLLLCYALCCTVGCHGQEQSAPAFAGDVVKMGELKPLVSTEFGRVTGARVSDGNETFLLHFFTLDPNSLFLPVLLHQDMVFYVHTGTGRLSYSGEGKMQTVDLERGDVFRLESGTVFFIQSNLDQERQNLRIHAIFGDAGEDLRDPVPYGPYSSIRDLILGFDNKTLQETFKVPEEVIEELKGGQKPEAIIHAVQQNETSKGGKESELVKKFLMSRGDFGYGVFDITNNQKNKKKKSDLYNIFSEKRDFENCNGWSTTVTRKKSSVFKNSKFGLFMVNLTHGGMMGPHWNPKATEIAAVLEGKGMVRVVCPGILTDRECKSSRFAVEEGDVFVVPRFHPMAQIAFNNDSFVFVGFSTAVQANHPQYIAGRASVLNTLDKQVLAMSLGVNVTTLDKIVAQQGQSVIVSCVSCAEEEYGVMTEEIQREKEEAREKEEEERRKKEEEARKKRAEEERKAEEEREKQRQEEEKKAAEEAARRAEEERKAEEEREKQKQEEEKKAEEEVARRAEEERKAEEEREKQRQEEEKKAEEERKRQQEEQEREAQRQEEEEARREQQAEAARRAQEAAERAAEEEREAAAKREEEEAHHQEQGGGQQPGGGEQQPGGQGGGEQQPGGQGGGEQQPGGGQGGGEQQPGGQGGGEQQPGGQGGGEQQPGGGQGGGEQQPGGQGGSGEQQPGGGQGGEQRPGGQGGGGEQQPGGGQGGE